ncbi:protein lin-52 homolog [Xenia sp. Carnegie-2017]|uniref:protein lin-52 homolog n=1 Tax=Xenia sp. Carnegie-2017 TaxID=2897299 RepID=UPI001F038CC5|nr:protein lin-52 homolog [Xenia sp. Carnegie-2017]
MERKLSSPNYDLDPSLQGLLSFERLDRSSPDLWPDQMPGISDFAELRSSPYPDTAVETNLSTVLSDGDMDLLQEFGSLTTAQLMEKVRGLQNLAYQLGLEEAREMTRGKFLNILQKSQRKSGRKL